MKTFRFRAVYVNRSVPLSFSATSYEDALAKARAIASKALAIVPVRS